MSVFSDRRSLRQIGGMGAYLRQVTWSVWWRLRSQGAAVRPQSVRVSSRSGDAVHKTGSKRRGRSAA